MIGFEQMPSPVGALTIAADELGLRHIEFANNKHAAERLNWLKAEACAPAVRAQLASAQTQLREYFAGTRQQFSLTLRPHGTEFQRLVWAQLAQIPFGKVCSYGELAAAIGKPRAVRAVGAANGRNPLPIVLPCHRVIGADGSLTGFGGGLDVKLQLLQLEGYC